jgi:hypothetical protein
MCKPILGQDNFLCYKKICDNPFNLSNPCSILMYKIMPAPQHFGEHFIIHLKLQFVSFFHY